MWQNFLQTLQTDKRRTALIIGGVILVGLLLLLVVRGGNKGRVLADSFENLQEATSYHTKATLQMTRSARIGGNQPRPIVEVTFSAEGDVQEQENGQPIFMGRMRNEARGTGMVLFADGELRLLPGAVAFRLENLPTLLNPRGNLLEKWTFVEVPALETKNPGDIQGALATLARKADYTGEEKGLYQYAVTLTPEEENILIEAFRQSVSGNRALHIVTRLLRAYDIRELVIMIDPQGGELRSVDAVFVRADARDQEPAPAHLMLEFSDYGKRVAVEEPPKELTVKPEVFGRIFGTGELEEI